MYHGAAVFMNLALKHYAIHTSNLAMKLICHTQAHTNRRNVNLGHENVTNSNYLEHVNSHTQSNDWIVKLIIVVPYDTSKA